MTCKQSGHLLCLCDLKEPALSRWFLKMFGYPIDKNVYSLLE